MKKSIILAAILPCLYFTVPSYSIIVRQSVGGGGTGSGSGNGFDLSGSTKVNLGGAVVGGDFISSGNITANGNITSLNGVFTGNGSGLSNLTVGASNSTSAAVALSQDNIFNSTNSGLNFLGFFTLVKVGTNTTITIKSVLPEGATAYLQNTSTGVTYSLPNSTLKIGSAAVTGTITSTSAVFIGTPTIIGSSLCWSNGANCIGLPTSDGTNNQVIVTDGNKHWSFAAQSASGGGGALGIQSALGSAATANSTLTIVVSNGLSYQQFASSGAISFNSTATVVVSSLTGSNVSGSTVTGGVFIANGNVIQFVPSSSTLQYNTTYLWQIPDNGQGTFFRVRLVDINNGGTTDQFLINISSVYLNNTVVSTLTVVNASVTFNKIPYLMPSAQASGTKFLQNDGSGNLSWATPAGGGGGGGGGLCIQTALGAVACTANSTMTLIVSNGLSYQQFTSSGSLSINSTGTMVMNTVNITSGTSTDFAAVRATFSQVSLSTPLPLVTGGTALGRTNYKASFNLPAGSWFTALTSGAGNVTSTETPTNRVNFDQMSLVNKATTYIYAIVPSMPADYDGSTISWRYTYLATTGTVGTTSTMTLQCEGFQSGDNIDTAYGTGVGLIDNFRGNLQVSISSFSAAVTCSGHPGANNMMAFKINRSAIDLFDGIVQFLGAQILYTKNSFTE